LKEKSIDFGGISFNDDEIKVYYEILNKIVNHETSLIDKFKDQELLL